MISGAKKVTQLSGPGFSALKSQRTKSSQIDNLYFYSHVGRKYAVTNTSRGYVTLGKHDFPSTILPVRYLGFYLLG